MTHKDAFAAKLAALPPLVYSVNDCAALVGVLPLRYRRTFLSCPTHPKPITKARPALYRKADMLDWLRADEALQA